MLDDRGVAIDQSDWRLVFADSEESIEENAPATQAFDGDPNTFWHTEWWPDGSQSSENDPPHPHEIVIDLGGLYAVSELVYWPRQDVANGRVSDYRVYLAASLDDWGESAAAGKFDNSPDTVSISLDGLLRDK